MKRPLPIRPKMVFINNRTGTKWEVIRSYAGFVEIKQTTAPKTGSMRKSDFRNNYTPDEQGAPTK